MKILFLNIGFFLSLVCLGQHGEEESSHHCHFDEKSITLGLAPVYSFHISAPGANLRMYYNIGEKICLGPEYGFFKTADTEIVDFDFVCHYIFETKLFGVCPLAGINYTIEKEAHSATVEVLAEPGVIFGAGIHRNFNSWTALFEYSRVELGVRDQFFTTGIMYTIK